MQHLEFTFQNLFLKQSLMYENKLLMGKPVHYSCLKAPEATQNWPTSSRENLDVLQVLILFELGDNCLNSGDLQLHKFVVWLFFFLTVLLTELWTTCTDRKELVKKKLCARKFGPDGQLESLNLFLHWGESPVLFGVDAWEQVEGLSNLTYGHRFRVPSIWF